MTRPSANFVSVFQLLERLKKRGLERAYFIFGDEPRLAAEARDAIVAFAENNGGRRIRLDGSELAESPPPSGGGLFGAGFSLLEVVAHGKPTEPVLAAMRRVAEKTRSPDALLIRMHDLESRQEKTAWLTEVAGRCEVAARAFRPGAREIAMWIRKWMADAGRGGAMSDADIGDLANRVEGNLAAARQVVDKLLLSDAAPDLPSALRALADGARYTVFDLADAALESDTARALRILRALRDERAADELILWSLSDAAQGVLAVKRGTAPRAWGRRLENLRRAARGTDEHRAALLLKLAARADRINKAAEHGDRESILCELTAALASLGGGKAIFPGGGK